MKHKVYFDSRLYRQRAAGDYFRLSGWYIDESSQPAEFSAAVDGTAVPVTVKRIARDDVKNRFSWWKGGADCGFAMRIESGKCEQLADSLEVWAQTSAGRECILKLGQAELAKLADRRTVLSLLESAVMDQGKITVQGWADTCLTNETVQFEVTDSHGAPVDFQQTWILREDVVDAQLIESDNTHCGFALSFQCLEQEHYQLVLKDSQNSVVIPLVPDQLRREQKKKSRKGFVSVCLHNLTMHNVARAMDYVVHHGFRGLKDHITSRLSTRGIPYGTWYATHKVTEEELEEQRQTKLDYEPKISIVVPTYRTPINFLKEMIESVQAQTYPNWELCLGDGSEGDEALERTAREYAAADPRVKFKVLEKNLGIAGNTNGALELATGDFIGLLDHDDILAPNCLFEVAKALNEDDYDVLYTDEDKVSGDLSEHNDPNFKPDYNPDLLCSHNYITHFFAVRKSIVDKINGFRSEFDGSQDYDFIFRCIENSNGKIKHIPKILYHWRIHGNSVAGDPASKMYAYEAGRKAIEEHLKRIGIQNAVVEHTEMWGMYHVIYATEPDPLVSIIIPNKDHIADLDKCVQSIYKHSKYTNFEFVVVENNSTEKSTFDYYERMQKEHDNFHVVTWTEGFNYSAINNFGVRHAKGEYLLFLNNDTELISENAIGEMLGTCMRPDVGIVGAKLYFGDDTIQHAGVVVGLSGFAGHVFVGFPKSYYGFMMRARVSGDYSAVTAACMMVDRKAFDRVNGFSEDFVVSLNDIDFCLKVRQLGLLVVFNAFAEWHHYESKSRGYEDTPEKIERFQGEIARFQAKWPDILKNGDPYYNPNFGYYQWPFTLKN